MPKQEGGSLDSGVFGSEMRVELSYESVAVCAVNDASHFDAFAAGCGAAETMHTDFKEELCGFAVCIEDIANDGVLCNFHKEYQTFLYKLDRSANDPFLKLCQKDSATILFYHKEFFMSISFL